MRYRAIFQSWAWAAGYGLLLIPTRLFPPVESQTITLLQMLLTLVYWFGVRRWQCERLAIPAGGLGMALLVGGVAVLAWLRWGVLVSPLGVFLKAALQGAYGLLVWTILHI